MSLPDYSEYLKREGMLQYIEEEWQKNKYIHIAQSEVVNAVLHKSNLNSVVEIGCATGNSAELIKSKYYTGIDSNEDCIVLAKSKRPDLVFIHSDIRKISDFYFSKDIVCAFSILKHFGLHEWLDIFEKISTLGYYFIFDIPIANETKDDGEEYHHVWKSLEELKNDICLIDMQIIDKFDTNPVEPIFVLRRK